MEQDRAETHIDVAPRSVRPARRANWSIRFLDMLSERSVGSLFQSWLAIVAGCGAVYWVLDSTSGAALLTSGAPIAGGLPRLLASLYFSAVTATSVGYGDIVPVGFARLLAILESVAGLLLFGCVISKF